VVQIPGGDTVRLGFRGADEPATIDDAAAAVTASLLEEAGALGWDADRSLWVRS
jgi:hypothetical protein